ncbi:hypothetical protein C8R44DRAFT_868839 [Mycena epipterygia]|nr:hypothetical protein C8R44DRAFT_868839 [Mycena epipterygia]
MLLPFPPASFVSPIGSSSLHGSPPFTSPASPSLPRSASPRALGPPLAFRDAFLMSLCDDSSTLLTIGHTSASPPPLAIPAPLLRLAHYQPHNSHSFSLDPVVTFPHSSSAPRPALSDTSNTSASPPSPPFADERVSSSLRTADPHASLLDVRRAAAQSLPRKTARKLAKNNVLGPSMFRPHVPADRHVLLWTAPHSLTAHSALQEAGLSLNLQRRIFEALLQSHVSETRESYGAGLLWFHQFCDREGIGESAHMPADQFLLAAFVADAVGSCTSKCIRNWLNGLHLWHMYNDAPWHGNEGWLPALKKSADKAGVSFKRPPRGPITRPHLRAYRVTLDLNSPLGVVKWSAALTGFTTLRDTCRSTRISRSSANGRAVCAIHLAWIKTTQTAGGECFLTAVLGPDADLCPVWAFDNHERVNHTPLFAFRSPGGWEHLTKDTFLRSSSAVFKSSRLDLVFGHSYRIGGSLELLSTGVAPEVIMKLGGWMSLCFLIYWRRLEQILPLAITRAWDARIAEFTRAHGHPVATLSLSPLLPSVTFAYGFGRARVPSPSDPDFPAAFARCVVKPPSAGMADPPANTPHTSPPLFLSLPCEARPAVKAFLPPSGATWKTPISVSAS